MLLFCCANYCYAKCRYAECRYADSRGTSVRGVNVVVGVAANFVATLAVVAVVVQCRC